MNDIVAYLGIQSWKPYLTLLLLPPIPMLAMILIGARLILPRRGLGFGLVLIGATGIWLTSCNGFALMTQRLVLGPPLALGPSRIEELAAEVKAKVPIAIVILGGGREMMAPEYAAANLTRTSLERLRYGVWLSRRTGAPIGFAGGIGWSQPDDVSESEVAARIAEHEFGRPIKWLDKRSRDTRENANYMVAQLRPAGIDKIVLVTNGWHMPRAVRNFDEAARASGAAIEIIPAPMAMAPRADAPAFDWLPTSDGFMKNRDVLREVLARLLGV